MQTSYVDMGSDSSSSDEVCRGFCIYFYIYMCVYVWCKCVCVNVLIGSACAYRLLAAYHKEAHAAS